ncbi:hypothetical protein PIB30_023380 [Stylosanthes scabra]|uniref:Uncharacterized protein n=1 Tax=Stylosanthes scabra TaxID=79078 RepID=A0ABU6V9B7_9FABA|nr:hypothetical protein [Stylosanthes scabra]
MGYAQKSQPIPKTKPDPCCHPSPSSSDTVFLCSSTDLFSSLPRHPSLPLRLGLSSPLPRRENSTPATPPHLRLQRFCALDIKEKSCPELLSETGTAPVSTSPETSTTSTSLASQDNTATTIEPAISHTLHFSRGTELFLQPLALVGAKLSNHNHTNSSYLLHHNNASPPPPPSSLQCSSTTTTTNFSSSSRYQYWILLLLPLFHVLHHCLCSFYNFR